MKKTVVLVSMVAIMAVFFCSPVFGSTSTGPKIVTYKSGGSTKNGVVISVTATQLWPGTEVDATYNNMDPYATHDIICTLQITNTNNYNVYIQNCFPKLEIKFTSTGSTAYNDSFVQPIEVINFGNDLTMTFKDNDLYFEVMPTADWSYLGCPCLTPNQTLSAVTTVKFRAYYNASTDYWAFCDLSSMDMNASWSVVETSFTPLGGSNGGILDALDSLSDYIEGNYGISSIVSAVQTFASNAHTDATNTISAINSVTTAVNDNTTAINNQTTQLHSDNANMYGTLNGFYNRNHTDLTNFSDRIHTDLANLYALFNSSKQTNITSDSNSLKSTSDSVHAQEQAYFTQNANAIQATGLSNYQFGTVEGNGIASVSNDFTSVWNALGGWTSVYIFSLTLTLALTIIRHAPSAINRKRKANNNG